MFKTLILDKPNFVFIVQRPFFMLIFLISLNTLPKASLKLSYFQKAIFLPKFAAIHFLKAKNVMATLSHKKNMKIVCKYDTKTTR